MDYEELNPIERAEALLDIDSGDRDRVCTALTRLALHDPDPEWLEGLLMANLGNPDPWVRGVAALCLGHVARIHGRLDLDTVIPSLERLLEDPETEGYASNAMSDIRMFVPSVGKK